MKIASRFSIQFRLLALFVLVAFALMADVPWPKCSHCSCGYSWGSCCGVGFARIGGKKFPPMPPAKATADHCTKGKKMACCHKG